MNLVQVLAWEWTTSGYSFLYSSDDVVTIETDHALNPELPEDLTGMVQMPIDALTALERLLQKIKDIKAGKTVPAPSLSIVS